MAFERDPKFYGELKQTNADILKVVDSYHKKSPYYDFTNTFQDYIRQVEELKKKFPVCENTNNINNTNLFSSANNFGNTNNTNSFYFGTLNQTKNDAADSTTVAGDTDPAGELEGENEEPPQPNIDKFCETGAKYEARCKLYELNKTNERNSPVLLGCGTLFVKELDPTKLHLIMRQDPDLRKVLFNRVITSSTPLRLLTKSIQLMVPTEDGKTSFYIAKVKDDNIASELYRILNSVKGHH